MGSPSLLHLVAIGGLAGCSTPPPTSDAWSFTSSQWRSEAGTTASLTVENLAVGDGVLTLRAAEDTPSATVLDAMIQATEAGVVVFDIGGLDGSVFHVQLPPPPTAARDFAVIHTGVSGMRVSAPGGAEHHVECDPCATFSDWSSAGVADALSAAGTGEVLVSVSPAVPWGAALSAFEASGERTLRIGREQ